MRAKAGKMDFNGTGYYHTTNLTDAMTEGEEGLPLGVAAENGSFREWSQQLLRNATNGQRRVDSFTAALQFMKIYYTPAIVVCGMIGNTIIWFTLLWTKLRRLSCTHYLSSVMLVNTMYMVALLVQWLKTFGIDLYNTPGLCQFVSFVNSLCVFLSVWLVVGFAVDRYIVSAHPAVSPVLCTTLRAKVVIVSVLLVGFVVYVNISLTVGVINIKGRMLCSPLPIFLHDLRILTAIDMVFNIVLPYTAILCMDLSLIRWHCVGGRRPVSRAIRAVDSRQPAPDADAGRRNGSRRETAWRVERIRINQSYADAMHVPMRTFAITFLTHFLLTHLPSELFRLVHTVRGAFDPTYNVTRWEYYCQVLSQHLYNTSLASHIVVFSLFHGAFRRHLLHFGSSCGRELRHCLPSAKPASHWTDLSTLGADVVVNNSANSSTMSTSPTCV